MEIVVLIILLSVCCGMLLKLTFLPLWGRLLVCIACGLFAGLSWESAAGQSKTEITDWLQNPQLMMDMAVLITVDVFMQVSFCILDAKKIAGERLKKSEEVIRSLTLWVPGILIFPTLYALLVEVIFSFSGVDFAMLAWSLALAVIVVGMVVPFIFTSILPEPDLRLELIFMINAMISLLGVVATVNGRTAVDGGGNVEWKALAGVVLLLLVGVAAGYFIFKRKNSLHIK